jgi:hypothetical protein
MASKPTYPLGFEKPSSVRLSGPGASLPLKSSRRRHSGGHCGHIPARRPSSSNVPDRGGWVARGLSFQLCQSKHPRGDLKATTMNIN